MLADDFASLFAGRSGVYGSDHAPRHNSDEVGPGPVYAEVPWGFHLEDPTLGGIGIYPVREDGVVSWGCVDIDFGYEDSWNLAWNLVKTLDLMGVCGWVERTRSKGYHVWVFVDGWVHHNDMRAALLVASSVAGVPAKEVNPKSFDIPSDKLGNYVRLPYPAGCTDRQVLIDASGNTIPLEDFLNQAWDNLTATGTIISIAEMYEPPAPKAVASAKVPEVTKDVTDRLTPLAWTIYDGGPYEVGGDRSGTLWKLAATVAQDETHTLEELVALTLNADARWGKFTERGETERVVELAEKAWGLHGPHE